MLTWELLGAVVGAGIASGREVASFFSRYGVWSIPGIVVAALVLISLADNRLPGAWAGRWQERLWKLLLSLLLIVTGGAMLSGAAEISALVLPWRGAYSVGMISAGVMAWALAYRTKTGLAWTGRALLIVLVAVVVIGLRMPADGACVLQNVFFPIGVIRAAAYGGFNAALLLPVMDSAQSAAPRQRKRALVYAGLIFACLVLAANAVILRHPRLLAEPLPFVRLLNSAGKPGFLLCAAGLYLAVLSTLTACFRGLGRQWYTPIGIAAVALLGFSGVVEVAYPLVGGGCLCMLAAAKFVNCFRKPFQSPGDML